MHQFVIDALDVDVGNVIGQQHNLVAMNPADICAPCPQGESVRSARGGSEGAGADKGVDDVHVLVAETAAELPPQHIVDTVNDEIDTLHRGVDNAELGGGEREGAFEEFLVKVLDDGLLAGKIVDVAHIGADAVVETGQLHGVLADGVGIEQLNHALHMLLLTLLFSTN